MNGEDVSGLAAGWRRASRSALLAILIVAGASSCGPEASGSAEALLDPLSLTAVSPTELLAGTALLVEGGGFVPEDVGVMDVQFVGLPGGDAVLRGVYVDDARLSVDATSELLERLGIDGGATNAVVQVVRRPLRGGEASLATLSVTLRAVSQLSPVVDALSPLDVFPAEELSIHGSGFLQISEGTSLVVFAGAHTTVDPPRTEPGFWLTLPARYRSRRELVVTLTPDVFGIREGWFEGAVSVVNQVPGAPDAQSAALDSVRLDYGAAEIVEVDPTTVRRGQRVRVSGHGFVPTDTALEATTLILLEGSFQRAAGGTLDYTGENALALFPDRFEGSSAMEYVLRVSLNPYGEPEGLGLIPGDFAGRVLPMLVYGQDRVRGRGIDVVFAVRPQLQVVHLEYLPSFDEAMKKFGLYEVRDRVRDEILAVCVRDYAGVNIRFQDEVPADFAEYSVVEILGADPNRAGLFGLDNTAGKDVGNLRFNDVVGGVNAETGEAGYYPYGGVFVESFLQFSAALSGGQVALATPRFDDVFGAFVIELGGVPVSADDLASGARDLEIDEAIRVLANLVGSTVTHEVGHSLGLAAIEGNYHNIGDEPNALMDAGQFRPFAERAALDGQGPSSFAPHNRAYLEEILPFFE